MDTFFSRLSFSLQQCIPSTLFEVTIKFKYIYVGRWRWHFCCRRSHFAISALRGGGWLKSLLLSINVRKVSGLLLLFIGNFHVFFLFFNKCMINIVFRCKRKITVKTGGNDMWTILKLHHEFWNSLIHVLTNSLPCVSQQRA